MNKVVFKYFLIVLLLTLFVSTGVSMIILSDQMLSTTKNDMLYSIKLVDYQLDYDEDLAKQVQQLNELAYAENSRLTIIDKEGHVLGDSDHKAIEDNHLNREEVQQALKENIGYATRYSSTLKRNMLYVAYYHHGYIVRLAIPYNGVFDNIIPLIEPLSISTMLSLIIALALSYRFSKTLTQPLTEISKEVVKMKDSQYLSFNHYKYDEFNIIAAKLRQQAEIIQETLITLKKERLKINNILDQMNEGFVLLDQNEHILMCNMKVKQLYTPSMKSNQPIRDYIFDYKIIDSLDNLGIEPKIVDVTKNEEIYRCFIARVDYGITLLFVNVTESMKAMKMRQEFFSNVSHELKTPMTSIRGYSELLQERMIDDPKIKQQALDKIQKEVDHMSQLINDILMISRLENKDIDVVEHPIHLQSIVEDILSSLQMEMNKKQLTVTYNIDSHSYISNHQHMYQLMNNLITNAVKYNKQNGNILIQSYVSENDYVIEVSDTGRGISLIDQGRVFERFFRCDAGRDKETGGTGLGLAIVKHIVRYYNGNIQLSSQLDEGTTFKIILPMTDR